MAIPLEAHDLDITRPRRRPGERVVVGLLLVCAVVSILVTVGIVAVLASEAARFFAKVSLFDFLTGTRWAPLGGRIEAGDFGILPLLNGSLMIAAGALVVGVPLGLATAIYLSEYARPRVRAVIKPALEILAGIPTVVVGFFALNFVTPTLLRPVFGDDRVFIFNAAAGAIAVGLMILPIIASISEDALRAVPQALREAAFGMGATKRVVSLRVVVPAALSGIAASVILGVSRAVGETMAVTIAAGNTPNLTTNFFESIQTLTAYIAQTVGGEAAAGSLRYQSLFAVGATLFVITLAMNLLSIRLVRRYRQTYQ
ncbi:MAG TPA: phosphate ABC transporter permease subunit PstC [Acidimicrobiales bacterium]|nr:phosphate ABC transporter permease subunit PstC [Acidimicrobiales bacterium]